MTYFNAYADELIKIAETRRPDDYKTGFQRYDRDFANTAEDVKAIYRRALQHYGDKHNYNTRGARYDAERHTHRVIDKLQRDGLRSGVRDRYDKPRKLLGRDLPVFKKKRVLHYHPGFEGAPKSQKHLDWAKKQDAAANQEGYAFRGTKEDPRRHFGAGGRTALVRAMERAHDSAAAKESRTRRF